MNNKKITITDFEISFDNAADAVLAIDEHHLVDGGGELPSPVDAGSRVRAIAEKARQEYVKRGEQVPNHVESAVAFEPPSTCEPPLRWPVVVGGAAFLPKDWLEKSSGFGDILIVDYEAPPSEDYGVLDAAGYKTWQVSSASEALAILRSNRTFELTLAEITPDVADWAALLDYTKGNYADMPVIAITTVDRVPVARAAMRNGAYDYLVKPFDQEELLTTLERALEYRRLKMENRSYRNNLESLRALYLSHYQESERCHRELLNNLSEGIFFVSPEGHFIDANDGLVRMLGYQNREELLKLIPATQVFDCTESWNRIIELLNVQDVVWNFEVSLRRRDGTLIRALENAFVAHNDRGEILQYTGVLLDITDIKNSHAQLQREREFTAKILNNTQTMIMVADTAGLISYANRRCYEAGTFNPQALVGNRLDKIIPQVHLRKFSEAFEYSLQGKQVDNLEISIMCGNGSQAKLSINLSPTHDEAGHVNSVLVLMTDITDAIMIQAKLMHTEKMAAVGQLVSGVAHEVNNPLATIMGFSDLLMENPDLPDSARKDLKVILEESRRTREIVKNLLSFASERPLQHRAVQVNALVSQTVALRSYDLSNSGIEVVKKFEEGLPDLVGDPYQLQQVFLNILNNAFDAVRATGGPGQIEIETRHWQDWIEISFRDNGEGIKYSDRIFDPFFTTKEVAKKTGLGLSVCNAIVREHAGEILSSNNKDMPGATFTVRLPLSTKTGNRLVDNEGEPIGSRDTISTGGPSKIRARR